MPVLPGAIIGCEPVEKDQESSVRSGDSCVQLCVFTIQAIQVSSNTRIKIITSD